MSFNIFKIVLLAVSIFLCACSDTENENALVDLFTAANQDIVAISFPDSTATVLSINAEYNFNLQGLKSNGLDFVPINKDVIWSVSDNSQSQIDNTGHFIAGVIAEEVTINANFGHLNSTFLINVSAAKFDKIVALNDSDISIEMCQTQQLTPIARYVDDNGNEEIRPLDSTLINSINWLVSDSLDTPSQKAVIKIENQQTFLTALSSGNIQVQASALSLASNVQNVSALFDVNMGNGLLNLKVCRSSDSDLNSCGMSSINIEQATLASITAVGRYALADGSNTEENITAASKWGLDNSNNISITHAAGLKQLDVTANTANTTSNISVACGDVVQNIQNIDVSKGVVLNEAVSCNSGDINCLQSSVSVSVDALAVTSIEVSANNLSLNSNQVLTLQNRPLEIVLDVNAIFSDSSSRIITSDTDLSYNLLVTSPAVVEEKFGEKGIYTVLGAGAVQIQLQYQAETFVVLIETP